MQKTYRFYTLEKGLMKENNEGEWEGKSKELRHETVAGKKKKKKLNIPLV